MKDVSIKVLDIECAACVSRLDESLSKHKGIVKVAVNFTASSVFITYDDTITDIPSITAKIKKTGFRVPIEEVDLLPLERKSEKEADIISSLKKIYGVKNTKIDNDGKITVFLYPIGVNNRDLIQDCLKNGYEVAVAEHRGGDEDQELIKRMSLFNTLITSVALTAPLMFELHPKVQFLIGSVLQFGPGRYFYKGAIKGLRNKTFGMDFLVSLSSTIIYLYSSHITFTRKSNFTLYFMSDGVLLSLILFGKYMELVASGEANSSIRKLLHLQPKTAMVLRNNSFIELSIDQINVNDTVLVRPGERIPVDGVIIDGECAVDESMLTGESLPIDKHINDKVIGGSINRSGAIKISATSLGNDSVLQQIVDIVRKAQCEKAPVQRFADKVAQWFVPAVVIASALTFFTWYKFIQPKDLEKALLTCCDVLSVACPCALGLATPTALMVGSSKAADNGILFKNGSELENAFKTDTIVFDKTGTLTKGQLQITDVITLNNSSLSDLLSVAYSLEIKSDHPISKAITKYIKETYPQISEIIIRDFDFILGKGLKGYIEDIQIIAGNRAFMESEGIDIHSLNEIKDIREEAKTEILISKNKTLIGVLGITDSIKDEAASIIDYLNKKNIEVWMLTGDNEKTAKSVAKNLGIINVMFEVLPNEKASKISELKDQGKFVCMVGDGINDTPSLASADCSVAMGNGSDIAIESAGILLPSGNLNKIKYMLGISSETIKTINQNLKWALFYNAISIPIAALGILHPSICATTMSLSSIGVLLHSLKLQNFGNNIHKRKKHKDDR